MSTEPSRPDAATFRTRLAEGEPLVGTFIKTPSGHATEVLGDVGFDFVVVDQEHAPFGRVEIDQVLLAARAANTAGIVRVPSARAPDLLSVLDCGAIGVLVPHVSTRQVAQDIVAACRYRGGKRGFSNSPRAGGYGRLGIWDHVDHNDAQTTVIAMIEDPEAVDSIESIVDVAGLDGVFIGRGDLTVAYGAESPGADEIASATEKIATAARAAGKAVCAMTAGGDDASWLKDLGVTAMIVASDQAFMRQAAAKALQDFRSLGA